MSLRRRSPFSIRWWSSDSVVVTGTTVTFVWDTAAGADSYVLQVGTSAGNYNVHNENVGDVLSHDLTLNAGTYYARVVPYGGSTPGTPTAEQTVTVS